jgi:uncharacterized Zn finger protein (UPF0148 family)
MLAIFGIDGGAISLVINLLVLFLIVTYLALIYWTYLDARRRIEDPVLIACATAASVFPFIGTVVYTILRPPEFLEDREERELELRAAELRLRQLIEQSCPHCEYPIETGYLRCPNCERKLRSPCRKCSKPLDPKWGVCPYCETEVRRQQRSGGERGDRESRRAERRDRSTRPSRTAPSSQPQADRPEGQRRQPPSQQQSSQRSAVGAQGRPQQPRTSGQRPDSR